MRIQNIGQTSRTGRKDPGNRLANPWLWCTLGYCGWLYWMSSGPVSVTAGGFPGLDKALHAAAYALLAVLAGRSLAWDGRNWPPPALLWVPALFAAAYGLSDELHQHFVPGRQADWLDWLADAGGGLAGTGVLALTRNLRSGRQTHAPGRLLRAGHGGPSRHD